MKKVFYLIPLICTLIASCNGSNNNEKKGYGACKKCTCPSFREDPETGKCINQRTPSTALCDHVNSDHK